MLKKITPVETVLEDATILEIVAEMERRLASGGSALNSTFRFEKSPDEKWTASVVDGWQPSHQLTCVGKADNITEWIAFLMGKPENKVIYLSIEDVIGFRGMQYRFQEQ